MIRGRARWRIRPARDGGFDLNLPAEERELLRELPGHLAEVLESFSADDEVPEQLKRLFPVANPRDDIAEARYVAERRDALIAHHRDALSCLAETAEAVHLAPAAMESWLAALNSLRLVLGSSLGITEEMDDPDPASPRYADWVCYQYLTYLAGEIVELLSGTLPPPRPGADDELVADPWGEPLGGLRWDGTPLPDNP